MSTVPDRIPLGRIRLTYEDYVELPDDGRRYEILDGDLEVTPSPTTTHQRVSRKLEHILDDYVTTHGLGEIFDAPTDVILANTTITVPDLLFVAAPRATIITKRAIEGPPDLIVEILSPTTARRDRTRKASLYFRFGVSYYWLVDPEERILETYERGKRRYRRTARHAGATVAHAAPFADLALDLAKVWG
jgi:Uma2 family endonuclease